MEVSAIPARFALLNFGNSRLAQKCVSPLMHRGDSMHGSMKHALGVVCQTDASMLVLTWQSKNAAMGWAFCSHHSDGRLRCKQRKDGTCGIRCAGASRPRPPYPSACGSPPGLSRPLHTQVCWRCQVPGPLLLLLLISCYACTAQEPSFTNLVTSEEMQIMRVTSKAIPLLLLTSMLALSGSKAAPVAAADLLLCLHCQGAFFHQSCDN